MRRAVINATGSCFRSVCNHPFLVGMLCFLILLHRASPFMFSLLVSASPVVVCTLLLLGTLLSFGQPNVPEIEIEEKSSHVAVSYKNGVIKNVAFSENDSLYGEGHSENKMGEADESMIAEDGIEDSADDSAPLIDRKSVGIESDTEVNRNDGLSDIGNNQWNEKGLVDVEIVENHLDASFKTKDDHIESETENSDAESFDSERVNVDSLDSLPLSPWRCIGDRDIDEDEDTLDSGSDGAESSSPDASMADIMPMLDELHPLLEDDIPQPIHIPRGGSTEGSEVSSRSSSSSHESDDEPENNTDVEDVIDDDGGGEEGEVQGERESGVKSSITWTEEDQKNLMDLGSSELERNQRLESLILRRRARKNLSIVPERNLIDFETNSFPFHVAPITTTRRNPFELPNDAWDDSGLPPIPSSAPSILLPRRNPFDIPYDSNEEKPNLRNDAFQEEFATFQSRELFFRRHESFNLGPSTFSHGRQDVRFRPYFVPEHSVSEESNYSKYQRSSSELSDSKTSSVPETESIGSVEHLEDQKFIEEEDKQDLRPISTEKEEILEEPEFIPETEVTEDDSHEMETVSEVKHVSEDVGHGSQSSEEDEESLELAEIKKRDVDDDNLQYQSPEVGDRCEEEEESVVQHVNYKALESNSGSDDDELMYNRNSSSPSLSEGEGLLISAKRHNDIVLERHLSMPTSLGSPDLNITCPITDDAPHKEPIYDSSPSAFRKSLSSSISSDVHAESDPCLPPVLVKRTVFSIDRGSEDVPKTIEMLPESSANPRVDEEESQRKEVVSISEQDDVNSDLSGAHWRFEGEDASAVRQRNENDDASKADQKLENRETSTYSLDENPRDQTSKIQVSGQSSNYSVQVQLEEEKHLMIPEKEKRDLVNMPNFHSGLEIRCSTDKEENVASPSSDVDVFHEADEKLLSTSSADGGTPLFYDVVMHEPFKHLEEVQVPNTPVGSFKEKRTITSLNIPQRQWINCEMVTSINSPRSPTFASMASIASGKATPLVDLETIIEEADEIKEIDEGILSELDSVSDFHTTRRDLSDSDASDKHVCSVEESISTAHSSSLTNSMGRFVAHQEIDDPNIRDSPDHLKSSSQTSLEDNESEPDDCVTNQNLHEVGMLSEVESDSFPRKAETVRAETDFGSKSSEAPHHSPLDVDNVACEIPETEAQTVKDINVALTQFSETGIEKPVVSESLQSEVIVCENTAEQSGNTNVMDANH